MPAAQPLRHGRSRRHIRRATSRWPACRSSGSVYPSRLWTSNEIATAARDARMSGPASPSLRVVRSGPGDVVARVTLSRPDVHNAFDAALIGDLRTAFATLARESPTQLRA